MRLNKFKLYSILKDNKLIREKVKLYNEKLLEVVPVRQFNFVNGYYTFILGEKVYFIKRKKYLIFNMNEKINLNCYCPYTYNLLGYTYWNLVSINEKIISNIDIYSNETILFCRDSFSIHEFPIIFHLLYEPDVKNVDPIFRVTIGTFYISDEVRYTYTICGGDMYICIRNDKDKQFFFLEYTYMIKDFYSCYDSVEEHFNIISI